MSSFYETLSTSHPWLTKKHYNSKEAYSIDLQNKK